MKRYAVPVIGVVLLVVLGAVAGVNYTQAQTGPQQSQHHLGAVFPELEGIPKDQLFDHFLGGQFNMTDSNGNAFTIRMTPGTVTAVTPTAITITPTGQTTSQAFNLTQSTVVHGMPARGSIQVIVAGDRVVIVTRNESLDAVVVMKHGDMFHDRMMDSMMR